jgi:hypothetical protein
MYHKVIRALTRHSVDFLDNAKYTSLGSIDVMVGVVGVLWGEKHDRRCGSVATSPESVGGQVG